MQASHVGGRNASAGVATRGLPGISWGWSQAWSQDLSPGTLGRDTGVPAAWRNCWSTHTAVSLPGAPEAQRGDCFFVGSVIFDCACTFFAILSLGFLDTLRRGFVFAWVRCLGARLIHGKAG